MTVRKPRIDPAKLKPISGRDRMAVAHPVQVVRKPDVERGTEPESAPEEG
jgi:hypothetical protein